MTSIATPCLTVLLMASPQVTVSTPIQPPQARDSSSQPKGTASIKGKVVAADGGRPVRRVQISLDFEGKDLADTPIEVRGGQQLDGITIVLSKNLPRLRGTLLTTSGQPAEGAVVLFPEDPSRWSEESRLVRSTRPDFTGTFEFRNLVPGDYLVAAIEYIREGDWADPTVLERLREQATRVRVHEGAAAPPVSLTLKK